MENDSPLDNQISKYDPSLSTELPQIYSGHSSPALEEKVKSFYFSIDGIFELWVKKCRSPHTQRAYRGDVMDFIDFMELDWPKESIKLLTVKITDVLNYLDFLRESGQAPKTMNRRIASLSSLYKYISAAAAELRLPITVPNPAHSQFVSRESSDPRDETKALSASKARLLISLPESESIVDYRDRAILKLYIYSGIRLGTGCRLQVSDFHVDDGHATLKIHEKGNKRRTIGLHHNASQAISEYIEKAQVSSGSLFRANHSKNKDALSSKPISEMSMYRIINSYLKRLPNSMKKEELDDGSVIERCIYTPHSLRATTATLLLDSSVDIRKVQDLLGHRHITTTQIYDKRRITTNQSASHEVPI